MSLVTRVHGAIANRRLYIVKCTNIFFPLKDNAFFKKKRKEFFLSHFKIMTHKCLYLCERQTDVQICSSLRLHPLYMLTLHTCSKHIF